MSKEFAGPSLNRMSVLESQLPPEIKALPTDWVPNEKPSKVLEKLSQEKQTLHNECISKLRRKMFQIKMEIDDEIKQVSNSVKDCIKCTKQSCEDLLQTYTFDFNKSIANEKYPEDVYKRVGSKVLSMCHSMKDEIDKLNTKLKSIEAKRMSLLKKLLAETREELNVISYQLPYDVQLFVEEEQMTLNQITLANQYAYSELQAQLTTIALSNKAFYMWRVEQLQAKYEASYERRERELRESKVDDALTVEKLKAFAEEITAQIFHINSEFTAAINVIYRVLDKIQQGKYDEVQQIEPNFVGVPKREFWSIHDEVYYSLWEEDAWEIVTYHTSVMMKRWTKVVDVMQMEVELCKKATVDGLHIWDKHFVRQVDASDIFGLDLWDFVNKNDDVDDVHFIDLNKAVDVLRSSSTEEDLKVAMGECKKIIDTIIKSNQKNYEKQTKFFDKFRDIMVQESEILYLEMSLFVKCMPSDDDVNPTIFRGRRSRIKIVPPEDKPVLMKEFDAEIKAMHNWLYGVSQNLKKGADLCTENAINYANKWIERNFIIVYVHHKIKISIVNDMYQQIFHHVYRVRLAELMSHQKRLDEHLLGLDSEMKKLLFPNIYAPVINHFKHKVGRLTSSLKTAKNNKTTSSLMEQLQTFKQNCLKDITALKDGADEKFNNRIQELLAVNVDYIKSLKYFGEGGNYSIDEVAEMKKSFTKANKDIVKNKSEVAKENDDAFDAAVEELGEIEKELIEESAEVKKQFQFKEFLDDHVVEVRQALHQETQDLVDASKALSNHVEHLKELAEQNIGRIHYLDDFASNCAYMEKIFHELHLRVYQAEPFNLSESFFKESDANDAKGKGGVKKADVVFEKLQEKLVRNNKEAKLVENEKEEGEIIERVKSDCFKVVFSKVPSGEDYMAKIVKILFESMEELQNHAQKYYEKIMLDDSDEEKLNYENNLKSFLIDHLAKYIYYQLQCDEILLEVTINYILELEELLSFMTDYYKRSMDAFVNDKLTQLRENCKNHKNLISGVTDSISAEYKFVMARLKPLHGHPKNKNLLDDIQLTLTQLEDTAYEQQTQLDELYQQYEAKTEENLNVFETQVEKMANKLKHCAEKFITMYIQDEHIFNQLKCKLAYFERIMTEDTIRSPSSETIHVEVVEKLNVKLKLLKMGLKVSDIEFSSIIENKWMQASSIKEKYSSGDYLTMSNASSLDFYLIRENFRDEQEACLRELTSSKGVANVVDLWNNVWRSNIDEINRLYTVKHVPAEKVEEVPQKGPKKEKHRGNQT